MNIRSLTVVFDWTITGFHTYQSTIYFGTTGFVLFPAASFSISCIELVSWVIGNHWFLFMVILYAGNVGWSLFLFITLLKLHKVGDACFTNGNTSHVPKTSSWRYTNSTKIVGTWEWCATHVHSRFPLQTWAIFIATVYTMLKY